MDGCDDLFVEVGVFYSFVLSVTPTLCVYTMLLCFILCASVLPVPVLMYCLRLMSNNKDLLTYLHYQSTLGAMCASLFH